MLRRRWACAMIVAGRCVGLGGAESMTCGSMMPGVRERRWAWSVVVVLLLGALAGSVSSAEPPRASKAESLARTYGDEVRPFLERHCLACHSGEKPKGSLNLDQLAAEFAARGTQERWLTVLKRVQAGEMPPKAKPRPAEQEVR